MRKILVFFNLACVVSEYVLGRFFPYREKGLAVICNLLTARIKKWALVRPMAKEAVRTIQKWNKIIHWKIIAFDKYIFFLKHSIFYSHTLNKNSTLGNRISYGVLLFFENYLVFHSPNWLCYVVRHRFT